MIKRILVVGGANGIGLSIAHELALRKETEQVYIVDKAPLQEEYSHSKIESYQFDLTINNRQSTARLRRRESIAMAKVMQQFGERKNLMQI